MTGGPGVRLLLRPWWLLSHVTIVALLVVAVNLGFWQLRRLDQRQAYNALVEERSVLPPVSMAGLVGGGDPDEVAYRSFEASGVFDVDREVYLANRSLNGLPGVHVVTLLVGTSGVVAVDRGFVPRSVYLAGDPAVWAPSGGEVVVAGRVRVAGTSRGGHGDEVDRVDVADLSERWSVALPAVYVESGTGVGVGAIPVGVPAPPLDEGPHLGYAVQWFVFFTIGLIGYPLVLVRLARRDPDVDDVDDVPGDAAGGPLDG